MTTFGPEAPARVSPAMRRALHALPVERDFPWRRTRDPWHIVIAEFCCQQTQAARAVGAYERCVTRFPTPSSCAAAPLGDVLEAWRGLGYYRRARALHDTAIELVERFEGCVPDDLASLLSLPGVGPYTARAVLAFGFERDVAVVDTNVARVLSRAIANRPLTSRALQALADGLVEKGRGWSHNQAMLDLGAGHCTAVPRCEGCPLQRTCRWHHDASGTADPARATALVSRPQSKFKGSDREGRGRLLAAVLHGPVRVRELAVVTGWPDDPQRASRIASQLVEEGLLTRTRGVLSVGRGADVRDAAVSP